MTDRKFTLASVLRLIFNSYRFRSLQNFPPVPTSNATINSGEPFARVLQNISPNCPLHRSYQSVRSGALLVCAHAQAPAGP
jgi:hypothetical protein